MKVPDNPRSMLRFRQSVRDIVRGRLYARVLIRVLGAAFGCRPIPLGVFRLIRRACRQTDALAPRANEVVAMGRLLRNPRLSNLLSEVELGDWSLDVATLNHLEEELKARRPELVLEFGSGYSTVCLAQYMSDLHARTNGPLVISIEQKESFADATRELLSKFGLLETSAVITAPVEKQIIEGVPTVCYGLHRSLLDRAFSGRRPGFCLVDGPISGLGSRYGTLPLVKDFFEDGTQFYMDDALRDSEMEIAERWRRLPYVNIVGLSLVGKGLLSGSLSRANAS